jgi:hypothetical protein
VRDKVSGSCEVPLLRGAAAARRRRRVQAAQQHQVAVVDGEHLAVMAQGGVLQHGAGDAAMMRAWRGRAQLRQMHHHRQPPMQTLGPLHVLTHAADRIQQRLRRAGTGRDVPAWNLEGRLGARRHRGGVHVCAKFCGLETGSAVL